MRTMHLLPRKGKRLRIYIGEAQEWQGKPLYRAILELAQQHGMAGATVVRGIEGFGHHRFPHTRHVLQQDMPIGEQCDQQEINDIELANDHACNVGAHGFGQTIQKLLRAIPGKETFSGIALVGKRLALTNGLFLATFSVGQTEGDRHALY